MVRWRLPCLSPSLSTCRNGLRWSSTLSTSLPCTKYHLLEIMVGRMALKLAAFSKRRIPVLLLLNFTLQLCSRLTRLENGFIRRQNCPIFWTNLVLFDFLVQCGWVICMNVVFSFKFKNRVVQICSSLKVKIDPGTARVSFSLDGGRPDPVSTNKVGLTTFESLSLFPQTQWGEWRWTKQANISTTPIIQLPWSALYKILSLFDAASKETKRETEENHHCHHFGALQVSFLKSLFSNRKKILVIGPVVDQLVWDKYRNGQV